MEHNNRELIFGRAAGHNFALKASGELSALHLIGRNQDLPQPLKISPDEEVEFLKRLYQNQLGISQRSTDILKQMIVLEEGDGYRWSGKSGGGDLASGKGIGWLVGFLETRDNVWIYAQYTEDESFTKMAPKRVAITRKVFEKLGLIGEERKSE